MDAESGLAPSIQAALRSFEHQFMQRCLFVTQQGKVDSASAKSSNAKFRTHKPS
jgi:hypothetical protein